MTMEIVYNDSPDDLDINSRNHEIRSLLATGLCEVTFTKVDGSVRTMPCTLKSDLLPARELKEHHSTKVINYKTLSVWCLDKSEWRSFKVMNVKKIERMST